MPQSLARTAHASPFAVAVCTTYFVTGIAYVLARAAASRDALAAGLHPSELWYSAAVLAVELLSIAALTIHGIAAATEPHDTPTAEVAGGVSGKRGLRRGYTVRVLVPCSGGSVESVRRTAASLREAELPDGSEVRLYLLDEEHSCDAVHECGRSVAVDVASELGDAVTAITAPIGPPNSKVTNSRSEMLNFALSAIYHPDASAGGREATVSAGDLVTAVSAGDTLPPSFFATLLRHIDHDDGIGAAAFPRTCGGTCAIFGKATASVPHSMGASGAVSAEMDSGLLLRARALQQVGGFPMRTLDENWELSMLLRSRGWGSVYAADAATVGGAPEETSAAAEVAAVMDAHYRRSCGRWQTFWSRRCPLLQPGLSPLLRAAYAGRCLQALASGLWTLVFTLVPIVHLITGAFPVHFSEAVVAAMAGHYLLRAALLLRCRSYAQLQALWLSRVATSILWWPDLKAATLTTLQAATGIPFTGTRGRAGRAQPRTLKPPRWTLAIVMLSAVAFAGGCMHLRAAADVPSALSLCFVAINAAPPLLLLARERLGRGPAFSRLCTLCMLASGAAAAAAFGFIPLLFPRRVDYARAGRLSLRFLNAERSGSIPAAFPVGWRATSGLQFSAVQLTFTNVTQGVITDRVDEFYKTVDLSGGWYTEGEAGPVKLTWTVAVTTSMLAWAMLEYPDFWQATPELQADATALMLHGALYMQEVYVVTPLQDDLDPTRLQSSSNDQLIYVVGHMLEQRQSWNRPEDVTEFRGVGADVGIMRLEESPSDLAGQVIAAITAGALALQQYGEIDRNVAQTMVDKAHRLFQSALFSPGLYQEGFNGSAASAGIEELYPATRYGDDLFWASTWMYRASTASFRTFNQSYYQDAMSVTMSLAYAELDFPGVSWDYMTNLAVTHAATLTQDAQYHTAAQSFLWDWLCDDEAVQYTRAGRAFFPGTPHLGSTAGAAAMAALYVHSARESQFLADDLAMVRGLQCFAGEQARYLLGGHVAGLFPTRPFIIGYNNRTYTRTWHRGASCPAPGDGACSVSVAIQDAPDVNSIDGALLWNPTADDFPQDARGRNTTVVSLENNFAVPLLFAAVHMQSVQHTQCLNARGTAFMRARVCRNGRPNDFKLGPSTDVSRGIPGFAGVYMPQENPADRVPPPPPPAPRPLVSSA